jgi:CRISPR/Cas system CSM-associated protein Csm3 (group 7 of RAMP superfamily)
MNLRGKFITETPLYRGNTRKTLFTRDGDGRQRLVSLAGEIEGTAQALMDAFIGQSRDGRNTGLLEQLWLRLYGRSMPNGLITGVECKLQKESYPRDNFFDLRMGLRLDEDRWAAEANANYKMETLYRHSVFDFTLTANDATLRQGDNEARLYYLLQELIEGRFWFGAGKSKGLGRCRLELQPNLAGPKTTPTTTTQANHLRIALAFDATNPVLVGWNWGKVDPEAPAFAAVEGRVLVEALRGLSDPIKTRLAMSLAGPILNPTDWKRRLGEILPRAIAIWLRERSSGESTSWVLSTSGLNKLSKGKYGLAPKLISQLQPLVEQVFPTPQAAEAAIKEALGAKSNMAKRVQEVMDQKTVARQALEPQVWQEIAGSLGLADGAVAGSDQSLAQRVALHIQDETALVETLSQACRPILPRFYEQIDQQINLLQSDAWLDVEIANRQQHLRIKTMLLRGKINETQWNNRQQAPEGVNLAAWKEFLESHSRVRFQHLVNARNLQKSITNDENFIAFLQTYRDRTRQELSQPHHIDFREGGPFNREVSRKYGKPYDTIFMRMLSWAPSAQEQGLWEIYIPGSTLKGAFKKRASQVLKTLWGESDKTTKVLERLFGRQGQRGLVFFSDAYLADPFDPNRAWCSMDGVKMNPTTGQPLEGAKQDYLFAYGAKLNFKLQLDLQDLGEADVEAFSLLTHLLQDFQHGDIVLGGEKTNGLGWVAAQISGLTWLTTNPAGLSQRLFGSHQPAQAGFWHKLELDHEAATTVLQASRPLSAQIKTSQTPPRARAGFISHRAFGGYCGTLAVEAEVLTPLHVRESGEPSYRATLADGLVNGWDFFSMSGPEAALRDADRSYALPSKTLRGLLRHLYAIASDSSQESPDISRLNPVDSLFGWVGQGQNQAIIGRLSFGFGLFQQPSLAWFKAPYPYTGWQYSSNGWQHTPGSAVSKLVIAKNWRLFPHAPLAPLTKQLGEFQPDTVQASYFRAILPAARARFDIRFWNLEEEELQRLVWCVGLEPKFGHKLGKSRHLGFGSLRLHILPDSHLIDWSKRYAAAEQSAQAWRQPFDPGQWFNPKVVKHYPELLKALNANQL